MGFPDEACLRLLALGVSLEDGSIHDELTGGPFTIDSPRKRIIPKAIMYVLSAYAEAKPRQPTGEFISARQIRGGKFYSGSNTGTKARLEEVFGREPASGRLVEAAGLLGGGASPLGIGDHSVLINPLPPLSPAPSRSLWRTMSSPPRRVSTSTVPSGPTSTWSRSTSSQSSRWSVWSTPTGS